MRLLPVKSRAAGAGGQRDCNLMQQAELPTIHSSIQQSLRAGAGLWLTDGTGGCALVLALGCWVVPLLKGYQPAVPLLSLAFVLVLVGEMVGRHLLRSCI